MYEDSLPMGKIQSKHVCKRTAPEGECFVVKTKMTPMDLMAAINSGDSIPEAFVELSASKQTQNDVSNDSSSNPKTIELSDFISCGKPDSNGLLNSHLFNIPLRVTLPPLSKETDLLKLLTVDKEKGEESDGIGTDTTDNNHGSEKAEHLEQDNECGVVMEANSGPELQEWLFTLYDFDDLGKITKEDIASLLKSLYDTVGSVITLQQQGTRVLKLHLTVAPDNPKDACNVTTVTRCSKVNNADSNDHRLVEGAKLNDSAQLTALKSTKHDCAVPSRKTSKIRSGQQLQQPVILSLHHGSTDKPPRITSHKAHESRPLTVCGREKGQDVEGNPPTNRKEARDRGDDALPVRQQSFCGVREATTSSTNVRRQRQTCSTSKRFSQFDEKHLARLIQQNMDLNERHPKHPTRRIRRRHSIIANKTQSQSPSINATSYTNAASADYVESVAHRRNYYLDLAGFEDCTTSKMYNLMSSTSPDFGITDRVTKSQKPLKIKSKMSSSAVRNLTRFNSGRTGAHGASSVCQEDEVVKSSVFVSSEREAGHLGSPTFHRKLTSAHDASQTNPILTENMETVSSSHYQRRHRHRERNQNRAMRQVAEWIEKEHVYHKSEKHVVVVQRHEHHHVHEHFHHHFHHCNNT